MRLEQIINIDLVKAYIAKTGARLTLHRARDVAHELAISEASKKQIHAMFTLCNDLNDTELTDFRALLGVESIFEKLSEPHKHQFCTDIFADFTVV